MWNRRDVAALAVAAVATFGLTLATFYPRLANAVDQSPATSDIKTPVLAVGSVKITAAMDPARQRTMILTAINASDEDALAQFSASAAVMPETSPFDRESPISRPVWTEQYSLNLRPHETKTLSVALPETAFVSTPPAPQAAAPDSRVPLRVGGSSFVTLTSRNVPQPQTILALSLSKVAPAKQVSASMFGSQLSSQLSSSIASASVSQWQPASSTPAIGPGPLQDVKPFAIIRDAPAPALPLPNPATAILTQVAPPTEKLTRTTLEQPLGPMVQK